MSEVNEKVMLKLLAEGNELAYTQVWRLYYPGVYRYLRHNLRSHTEADEATQEVFLRIWIFRERLANVDNLDSYMFAVKQNVLRTHINKLVLSSSLDTKEVLDLESHYKADNHIQHMQLSEAYAQVVDALPPQRKRVYKLAKEQEMTYDQVAAEVGISKNVVKTHLKEAFKFVKARLKTFGSVMLVLGVGQFFR